MDDIKSELLAVTLELSSVEQQLDDLFQRQHDLKTRKTELEKLLKQSSTAAISDASWEKQDFKWSKKMEEEMKNVFKINKLRPMQLQTMNVTLSNKDCILIMPTGGGKSLCFQLPALLSEGITLVVSPLVSLMEDQVMALQNYNVEADMLNASADKDKVKEIQEAMIDKNAPLKLLYVTPEKLAKSKRFMARLEKMYKVGRFARLVIDEVHCCSQWGHDFRPDYKYLGIMKRQFPEVPILGLTATATSSVLDDVKKILNIQGCFLFRASFNRPNLFYEVRNKSSVQKEVMEDIQNLISKKFHQQSGIIYTFSKKDAEDVTADLQSRGIKAGCYHADFGAKERSRIHRAWINNQIHVVVATIAFGMGIDKPDVRFVIHHSISKSMENLYQESGRAGRDDKKAHCIIYYRFQDVFRQSSMVMAEQTGLKNLYGIMAYCVDISKCRRSMIAQYFGEVWEKSQCNKMCDHCVDTYSASKKDVTTYCSNVMKIIDNAVSVDQKLTPIKLMDAWQGKGPSALRVKGTDTGTEKEKLERILAHMMMKKYIVEDFHFTPYATISYLVSGPKAGMIRNGTEKVFIEMPERLKSSDASSGISSESSKSSSEKPQKIVNDKKSASTNLVKSSSERKQSRDSHSSHSVWSSKDSSSAKKRKPVIVDSDSDKEEFDFGNSPAKSRPKKSKSSA